MTGGREKVFKTRQECRKKSSMRWTTHSQKFLLVPPIVSYRILSWFGPKGQVVVLNLVPGPTQGPSFIYTLTSSTLLAVRNKKKTTLKKPSYDRVKDKR